MAIKFIRTDKGDGKNTEEDRGRLIELGYTDIEIRQIELGMVVENNFAIYRVKKITDN